MPKPEFHVGAPLPMVAVTLSTEIAPYAFLGMVIVLVSVTVDVPAAGQGIAPVVASRLLGRREEPD